MDEEEDVTGEGSVGLELSEGDLDGAQGETDLRGESGHGTPEGGPGQRVFVVEFLGREEELGSLPVFRDTEGTDLASESEGILVSEGLGFLFEAGDAVPHGKGGEGLGGEAEDAFHEDEEGISPEVVEAFERDAVEPAQYSFHDPDYTPTLSLTQHGFWVDERGGR